MNSFIVNMPKKIHFNVSLPIISKEITSNYENILVILPMSSADNNATVYSTLEILKAEGKNIHMQKISSELSDFQIGRMFDEFKDKNIECILAIGGGSVMDAGKIMSAFITNGGTVEDYINNNIEFKNKSIPLFLAPTTHSSAEANSSVFICSHYIRKFRTEIKDRAFIADEIIIDPSLSVGTSKRASLNAMMISLTHLVEGYVSKNANPFCDALISDTIADFVQSIYDIYVNDVDTKQTRSQAAYSSVIASLTKEHSGCGIIAALANAITEIYQIPYGSVCGSLLYHATLKNMQKTQMFAPKSVATEKYARLASIWSGIGYEYDKHNVLLRSLNHNLMDLKDDLKIPTLSQLGIERDSFYNIVSRVLPSENPVNFAESELIDILEAAF